MKNFIVVFCFLIITDKAVFAQDYTIRYGWYNYVDSSSLKKKKNNFLIGNDLLVTNGDSISYYCSMQQSGNDPGKKIGDKQFHHAVYTFPIIYKHLDVNAWTKPYNLGESDTKIFNWTIKDDTVRIEGYLCQLAVSETKKERAWFTKEIPVSSGPSVYNDLPGLILRLEDYKYGRMFIADRIRTGAPKIILTDLPIKPCEHCVSKVEEIKKYFEN